MTLKNSLRKTRRKRGGGWRTISGGRRKKHRSRKKRGGVDFQEGDKVKFSPKMREDLTGVRSERALNWMETWTGTVESVNDAKPKKAVQVYWKTGGGSEGWTSVPKEHLIKLSGSQTGSGRKRKTRRKRRRSRRKRRKTRRKRRRKRRKKQRGGNPQKDMHDAIKEDHELGVKQAIHNGAKVNQPRNYTKPKPLEKDTPEGRVCTGEVVMRKGKHTPLIRAVQENSMMGIVENILGDRVGQEPGIDLKFKDPYYEPPKTAQEIAEEMGNKGALKRIKERANSDAGLGSGRDTTGGKTIRKRISLSFKAPSNGAMLSRGDARRRGAPGE